MKVYGASMAGVALLSGAFFAVQSAKASQSYSSAILPATSVTTQSATPAIEGRATLRAMINAGGRRTNYWFEYGTDPSDATTSAGFIATEKAAAGKGSVPMAFATDISKLSPKTAYYFRAVIENASSTIRGDIAAFSTK